MDPAARDVQSVLGHYKDLKIGSGNYGTYSYSFHCNNGILSLPLVHNDGRKEMLFRLKGTIPVSFRGRL